MYQVGITREGEVSGQTAYPGFLSKHVLAVHLSSIMVLFGWTPEALPIAGDEEVVIA
jgi:hypothetical protein